MLLMSITVDAISAAAIVVGCIVHLRYWSLTHQAPPSGLPAANEQAPTCLSTPLPRLLGQGFWQLLATLPELPFEVVRGQSVLVINYRNERRREGVGRDGARPGRRLVTSQQIGNWRPARG